MLQNAWKVYSTYLFYTSSNDEMLSVHTIKFQDIVFVHVCHSCKFFPRSFFNSDHVCWILICNL